MAMEFSENETYNLKALRQSLLDKTYTFDGYIEFPVFEPKERIVNAPYYKDKVVQLAINNVLKEVYNASFIYDSYACIDFKGTHRCVERISKFMCKSKWEYGTSTYIIKMDIEKFFYSIDRNVLKKILVKKIKCQRTIELVSKIIDSADSISSVGLPLGNTLSQICANIYMDVVDQYAKRVLGLKYYVRYADDIIAIVKDKETATKTLESLNSVISGTLHLRTNKKKTKIFPISQGVNAIGFKIYPTHRLLRDDSKRKIKRKLKKFPKLFRDGKITVEKVEQILRSWYGHAGYACSYNFIRSLMSRFDYIYVTKSKGKIVLKINESKLEKWGDSIVILQG